MHKDWVIQIGTFSLGALLAVGAHGQTTERLVIDGSTGGMPLAAALAKSRPGELNYASPGAGSLNHLTAELFNLTASIKMTHIPYKGGGPALIDVLGGRVPIYYTNLVTSLPHLKSGKLRALGVMTLQRSQIAPELPTIAEAGLRGFDMSTWFGLLVPSATPRDVIAKLQQEVTLILHQAEFKERLAADGMTVVGSTPEQFGEFLNREIIKYTRIIHAAGITAAQ